MLDHEMLASLEQTNAHGKKAALPRLWSEMYRELREHFNEQEAWELLKLVVSAQAGASGMSV